MKANSIIPLLIIIVIACNSNQSGVKQINNPTLAKTLDTLMQTDSTRASNYYKRFSVVKTHQAQQNKLDSLIYSFDSLQIKLWNITGLYANRELYIISKHNSKWVGFYYQLQGEYKYATGDSTAEYLNGPVPLEVKRVKQINPKSGWAKFSDSLLALKIMSLPDMNEIEGMKISWTDASSSIVEVSTKDHFRFYSYSEPQHFADKFWEAKKMVLIQNLFFTEFIK